MRILPSIRRCGTARRANPSLSPWRTSCSLPRSWTSWGSTTSKAAGRGPIPRTRSSSSGRVGTEAAARQADGVRLHAVRQESRASGPQRPRTGRGRNARASRFSARAGTCTRKRALGITEEENLTLIGETVRYLKEHGKEVVYDAEHFFDGYKSNPRFRPADARSRADRPAPMCSASATPMAAR